MTDIWAALRDPETQKTLTWLGGGLAAAATGASAVVKWRAGGDDAPSTPTSMTQRADHGSTVIGRDQIRNENHGLTGGQAVLLVLAVGGLVLLATGLLGDRITATNSAATGGSITNSTVTINGGKP